LQNPDKQAKVRNVPACLSLCVCLHADTPTRKQVWKNKLTGLSINPTTSRQRRLQLWKGIDKNSGAIKGVISYNCYKTEIEEIKDDSKRVD